MTKRSKPRITGVAVKIQRVKTTVREIVDYILDLSQNEEKLLFPAWLKNIHLPQPLPGKPLTRQELNRALTDEIERNLMGVQPNRRPAVEIIISLAPGEAWSPKQWEAFWERFTFHLSRVTYVTDHCVRRQGFHLKRARPPEYIQADLSQYMAIIPCHDNTASQHLQPLLILWDPMLRQVALINEGFSQIAVQWAARRAEEDLQLKPHKKMPDYLARVEGKLDEQGVCYLPKDNRLRIVEPKLIKKIHNNLFIYQEKRPTKKNKTPRSSMRGFFMRHAIPAIDPMRVIMKDHSPGDFANLRALDQFLRLHRACLRRPPKTAGLLFCFGGSMVKPSTVDSNWLTEELFQRWPGLKRRGRVVGMPPEQQQRLIAQQNISRLQAAGLSGPKPSQNQLNTIVRTAHASIDRLPWQNFLIEERRGNGTSHRCGEMTQSGLKAKITKMFYGKEPELDVTLHFRPVLPPGGMALPLWDLTKHNADRLCQNYAVALLTEPQPGHFNAMIRVAPLAGEEWENKRALRRLTLWLARRYKGLPDVVAADGVPLPGLPQLSTTGHVVRMVGPVHDQSCPKASRQLARLGAGLATLDKYWAQGKPGWILRQPEVRQLALVTNSSILKSRTIYLKCVKALAKNPIRCGSLTEMNQRIAARMSGQRYENMEIWDIFQKVHGLWPKFVPDPLDCLHHFEEYAVDYLRDRTLFEHNPFRSRNSLPLTSDDQVARDTPPPIGITPTALPRREDPPPPPASARIEPDVLYEKYTPPVLAQVLQWGHQFMNDLIKQFRPDKSALMAKPVLAATPPSPARTPVQKTTPAQSPSSSPVLAKTPDASQPDIQNTRELVPGRSLPKSAVAKCDPVPEKKPAPLSPTSPPPMQNKELKRLKKEKYMLWLAALVGGLAHNGKVSDAVNLERQLNLNHKIVMAFKMWWDALEKEPDSQQLKPMLEWAQDPEQDEPEWLQDRLEFYEARCNEMLTANEELEQSASHNTQDDLIR